MSPRCAGASPALRSSRTLSPWWRNCPRAPIRLRKIRWPASPGNRCSRLRPRILSSRNRITSSSTCSPRSGSASVSTAPWKASSAWAPCTRKPCTLRRSASRARPRHRARGAAVAQARHGREPRKRADGIEKGAFSGKEAPLGCFHRGSALVFAVPGKNLLRLRRVSVIDGDVHLPEYGPPEVSEARLLC